MQFIIPGFLLAALAIAIPIIIHLFYFRKFKQVYFTNVRFLREIKEQTASRSRLRNLLVLLARILTIICLVLAFAQPFLPRGEEAKSGPKAVSLFIDNSFSMEALSKDVSLLEMAKLKARQIVQGYSPQDRFQILTNDFSGMSQRLVQGEEAMNLIDDIRVSPVVQTINQALYRQQYIVGGEEGFSPVSYLISDFQTNIIEEGQSWSDSLMKATAIPMLAVRSENVAIDSAWFESPVLITQKTATLIVSIRNYNDTEVEQIRLSIKEGAEEKPVGAVNIPPQQTIYDTISYTPRAAGWQQIELSINDFPIQFDDRYYLGFEVLEKIQPLVVFEGKPTPFLEKGLSGFSAFAPSYQDRSQLAYSELNNYQLIILDGLSNLSSGLQAALNEYMNQGGNVLIFPPPGQSDMSEYNTFLAGLGARQYGAWNETALEIGQINTLSFVFKDVYTNAGSNLTLPDTKGQYLMKSTGASAEEKLLVYRNGESNLGRYAVGSGNLFQSAAPLGNNYNSLGRNGEIFIPMLYKMALSGVNAKSNAYTLGINDEARLNLNLELGPDRRFRLRQGDTEVIPPQRFIGSELRIGLQDGLTKAGVYDLLATTDSVLAKIAINYDRRESDQVFASTAQISEMGLEVIDNVALADLSVLVGEKERGILLWRWFVILGLIFIGAEILLLRFWKV